MTAVALPGRQGIAVQGWLAVQTESLRPELATLLGAFQEQSVPWKPF